MNQFSFTPQNAQHLQRLFFAYLNKEIDLIPSTTEPNAVVSNFLSPLVNNLARYYTRNRSRMLNRVIKRKCGEAKSQVERYQKQRRLEGKSSNIQFVTEPYLLVIIFSFLDLKDLLMLRASNRYFKIFFQDNFERVLSNYTETLNSRCLSCNYLVSIEHNHYNPSLRKKLVLAGAAPLFVDQCIAEQYVRSRIHIGTEDAILLHAYPFFRSQIGFRIRNFTKFLPRSSFDTVVYPLGSKLFIMNPNLETERTPLPPNCDYYFTIPGIGKGIVENANKFPSTHRTIMTNCFEEDYLKCPQKKITFFYTCILRKLEINVLDITLDKEMALGVRLVLFSFKDTFILEHKKIIRLQRKQQDQLQYRHDHWHLQRANGEVEIFKNYNYFNNLGSDKMNIFFFKKYYESRPYDKEYMHYLLWLNSLGEQH